MSSSALIVGGVKILCLDCRGVSRSSALIVGGVKNLTIIATSMKYTPYIHPLLSYMYSGPVCEQGGGHPLSVQANSDVHLLICVLPQEEQPYLYI